MGSNSLPICTRIASRDFHVQALGVVLPTRRKNCQPLLPLKIALIHFTAPPLNGGVERVIGEQIRILRKNGHTLSLACFEGGGAGEDVHIPLSRASSCADFVAYLSSALSGNDVIFMHNVGSLPDVPALTEALWLLPNKIPSARWICWVHDLALTDPEHAWIHTKIEGRVFTKSCEAWEYVAVSELRAGEVEEHLGVACVVVPNGVDPGSTLQLSARTASLAEAGGWWEADAVLLHPSRLMPRKNVEAAIHLARAAREQGFDLKILLTGAEDLETVAHATYGKYLKTLAASLRLQDAVFFLGGMMPMDSKEFCDFNLIADGLFFSGQREGFGLPVLEAGVLGRPIFCPNCEPLTRLPGAVTYPVETSAEELATWLIGEISEHKTIMARRQILRDYRWPHIYLTHLVPLLQRSPLPYHS